MTADDPTCDPTPPLPRSEGAAPTTPKIEIRAEPGNVASIRIREDDHVPADEAWIEQGGRIVHRIRGLAVPNSPKNSDSSPAAAPAPGGETTPPFDDFETSPLGKIMREHDLYAKCSHGVVLSASCAECEKPGPETDPWFVMDFCAGAISDAIYAEEGLDGAAGERVLKMIRNAKAARVSAAPSDAGAPTPQGCPTCGGKGVVLWDPAMPTSINGTSAGPWTCPTCNGTRVLWSRQPDAPADRAAVSEDVAGLLKETTYWLERTRTFTFPRDVIERLAAALRAVTDRAERIGKDRAEAWSSADTLSDHYFRMRTERNEQLSRLATAIERVKALDRYRPEPCCHGEEPICEMSDSGEYLDRDAVLALFTAEKEAPDGSR